jgi:phage repressor protein C with HTH and peptisase S24 domain
MAVADRIRELASDKSLNIKDFSAFLDVSERTIQNYLAGISLPNGRFLVDLAEKTGASPTWVLVGQGSKYVADAHQKLHPSTPAISDPDFVSVPRYAVEASAGQGALPGDEETTGFYAFNRKWLARRGLNPDRLSIISVKGDSMEPGFCNNDLILVDQAQTRPADGLIFVFRVDTDLFLKRVQTLPDGNLQLISANKMYPPILVDATKSTAFKVIGRVVASMHEW